MSNNKYKVLLIEDDKAISNVVGALLESGGYASLFASRLWEGKTMYLSHTPDLVILDLGLPDGDGTEFISFVRERSQTPIIVLSARGSEEDKVRALDLGSNDYITKPFGTAELLARVRATLRVSVSAGGEVRRGKFALYDLVLDYDRRTLTQGGEEIPLTQTEYNILAYISRNSGKVLTYAAIIKAVWGYSDAGSVKRLQVNMANIRKKLGITPGDDRYIKNELGVGYRMLEEK